MLELQEKTRLFVIYSSCNFLPVIGIMDIRILAAGTAGRWKQTETSGRIASVPKSLLGFLLALQWDWGFLVDLALACFVFSKIFESKYSEHRALCTTTEIPTSREIPFLTF